MRKLQKTRERFNMTIFSPAFIRLKEEAGARAAAKTRPITPTMTPLRFEVKTRSARSVSI
ncbi:MAG: hypothetical protein A3G25_04705 [Betaproteobacteria bacterium RIFCSPLOWO2_12_FULL_63_13]|nr:MAG: hypothetical protein A3G25_04705 [Betaproteobacteria bacterium RIFCSPLOWO2_12_FULL_63_13]